LIVMTIPEEAVEFSVREKTEKPEVEEKRERKIEEERERCERIFQARRARTQPTPSSSIFSRFRGAENLTVW